MRFIAALLLAFPLLAQTVQLGNPVPVTDTRYGSFAANTVLTSNGRDFYAVWGARENVRFTRIVENERRVARPIFDGRDVRELDMVWTGTYFVVLAESGNDIIGRILDERGDPVSGVFTLRENAATPRLAWDGQHVLVLYQFQMPAGWQIHTLRLRPAPVPVELNGTFVSFAPEQASLDIASNGTTFAAVATTGSETKLTILNAANAIVRQVVGPGGGDAAIASNGSDYLAVTAFQNFLDTTVIRANGTVEPSVAYPVSGTSTSAPSVAWNAGEYVVSYLVKSGSDTTARVAHIKPDQHALDEDEDAYPALEVSSTSIAAAHGQVLTTWQWNDDLTASMRPVTDSDDDPDALAYGAGEQAFGASASSATGLLVAWSELADGVVGFYTGVRKHDGRWTEQRISPITALPSLAASDGSEFLVIANQESSFTIYNLDAEGKLQGSWAAAASAGTVHDVVWAGDHYVIAYVTPNKTMTLGRLDRNGVLTQSVVIGGSTDTIDSMSLASDGTSTLVVWQRSRGEQEWIEATRFNHDLQRLDVTAVAIAGDDSYAPRAILDGANYLVVWHTKTELAGATLAKTSGGPSSVFTIARPTIQDVRTLRLAKIANGIAAYWQKFDNEAFLVRGTQSTPFETPFDERVLVTLPDNSGMFVGTQVNLDAPHHGARRIFRRGVDVVPFTGIPNPPPSVTIRRFTNSQFRIEWIAPAQPVDGYRVEYKVGDGLWLELGRWFDPDERLATWPSVRAGESYQFRVRAFSEAGTSLYTTAGIYTGKRRSVH
jgi:hypothetical protein